MKIQKLKLAGDQLLTRATFEPASFNAERASVDLVWTTGARGARYSWDEGRYYEELEVTPEACDLTRLNNGAPLLNSHSANSLGDVVGVVERAWIQNGVGHATVRFSDREDVKPILKDVQSGILRHISVGYRVNKYEKVEETDGVPVYRATNWQPMEMSLVPMGFDDAATVRSADKSKFWEVEVQTRGMAPQNQEHAMADENQTKAPAKTDADRGVELEAVKAEVLAAERARATEINALVRKAGLDSALADDLVKTGKTVDQARAVLFDKLAERSESIKTENRQGVDISVTVEEKEKTRQGIEAALFQRYGLHTAARQVLAKGDRARPESIAAFKSVSSDAGEFGGKRISRLAEMMLARAGHKTLRMSDREIIDLALRSSGGNTESDFSVLLANLMYKQSLGQYELADDTWTRFCKTDTVQDFRASNRYRIGSFGVLDVLPEGAEYKNKSIPDGLKFPITVQTYGDMLHVSRQALVDDDMGAVLATAGEFGRAAGLTIEKSVYDLLNANSGLGYLTDGSTPFFDSTLNGNVNGTGSALSVDALDADRVIMAQLTDISANEYLGLRPSVLLVPIGLEGKAKVINRMEYDGTSNVFQVPNKVQGLFRDIVGSPRLTSTTRRYLFTDGADAIKVAFLNGQQTPFLEQRQEWRVDGVSWKLRIDFKSQWFDPKGAVTNAGT